MIQGRSGGSGKYSYREAHNSRTSVKVSHMPEEDFHVRITFTAQGEISLPIIKLSEDSAELLWAALGAMAIDLKWDARMPGEKISDDIYEKK